MSVDTKTLPPALGKGTIAFISPSSRVNHIFPTRVSRAATWLHSQGFRTKEIFTPIPAGSSYIEAVRHRCNEIHQAFADPQVTAIICTIGGCSANDLLLHLDYALIAANPKIFCGYSDITLLHHALYAKSHLRTFYGPAVVPEFGEFPGPHPFTLASFLSVVNRPGTPFALPAHHEFSQEFLDWSSAESDRRARRYEPAPGWTWLRPGKAAGRIFGGCLGSLKQIRATEWWVEYKGRVMFLETSEGPSAPDDVYTPEMARMDLCDLRNAGVLDGIVGLVVGRPLFYDAKMRGELQRVVLDQTEGLGIPVLANVDIGHTSPALTVPLDALSELDSTLNSFKILEI